MTQLELTLLSKGWTQEEIFDTAIETYNEVMEYYSSYPDEDFMTEVNNIIEENFEEKFDYKLVFSVYDKAVEDLYFKDYKAYRKESDKAILRANNL